MFFSFQSSKHGFVHSVYVQQMADTRGPGTALICLQSQKKEREKKEEKQKEKKREKKELKWGLL